MQSDHVHPSTARISVSVIEFHEIGEGSGCSRADIELIDTGNGKVSQGRINDPIVVTAEAYLEFFVSGRKDEGRAYLPVGIGFRSVARNKSNKAAEDHCKDGDDRDPLGTAAFPLRHVVSRGNTTQLTLFDAIPEAGEFEFSLIIQRSDGALSVVDPKIRNNPILK